MKNQQICDKNNFWEKKKKFNFLSVKRKKLLVFWQNCLKTWSQCDETCFLITTNLFFTNYSAYRNAMNKLCFWIYRRNYAKITLQNVALIPFFSGKHWYRKKHLLTIFVSVTAGFCKTRWVITIWSILLSYIHTVKGYKSITPESELAYRENNNF